MTAYYNEFDKFAAEWLRQLIKAGHIAPGIVDERSIEDVTPGDLAGFTQCHFFAGIGVWSYALRRAGWPDSRRVWTASCPCQPFSSAGKGDGFADERHLWPSWHYLIGQRRPPTILGEQVASKDAEPWIDLVQADLEAMGYAFGAVPFPSAGVGAPHIRDRLYWCAGVTQGDTSRKGLERHGGHGHQQHQPGWIGAHAAGSVATASGIGGLADDDNHGRSAIPVTGFRDAQRDVEPCGGAGGLADRKSDGHERSGQFDKSTGRAGVTHSGTVSGLGNSNSEPTGWDAGGTHAAQTKHGAKDRDDNGPRHAGVGMVTRTGPTNGFWRDVDWLGCRDGKWRPVEPGTFPLAHGAPARVGRLRAYGNAINAEAAKTFIEAVIEGEIIETEIAA